MLTETSIAAFKAGLRGELIEPGSPRYDEARKVYNAMIDRRPRLIARCADVADVITAVNFGRDNKLLVSIRSGGHNAGGLGVCDDGLVIDLSPMRYVRVDPKKKTILAGGGALWGDVDHAAHAFGLAVPAGIISTTGVGGLTLGRRDRSPDAAVRPDHRQLARRRHGAGGREVRHRQRQGERGSLLGDPRRRRQFRRRHIVPLQGAPDSHQLRRSDALAAQDAVEVMRWYRRFITKAPRDINGFFAFLIVPPGPPFPEHLHIKKMCGVVWCYTGPIK